jgi:amino acid transporter
MNHSSREQERNVPIAIIAIIAALALLGVVIVLAVVTIPLQEAEAGCENGRGGSLAFNQSKGKCLDRGTI